MLPSINKKFIIIIIITTENLAKCLTFYHVYTCSSTCASSADQDQPVVTSVQSDLDPHCSLFSQNLFYEVKREQ
jgi:hypothetical protein